MTHAERLTLDAALIVVLTSCSYDGPPATPSPPVDAPTALVYGMTNSPVYEALKSKVEMTVRNET